MLEKVSLSHPTSQKTVNKLKRCENSFISLNFSFSDARYHGHIRQRITNVYIQIRNKEHYKVLGLSQYDEVSVYINHNQMRK